MTLNDTEAIAVTSTWTKASAHQRALALYQDREVLAAHTRSSTYGIKAYGQALYQADESAGPTCGSTIKAEP